MATISRPVVSRPTQVLRLPDGRRMGYGEFGDPAGSPVLFCHGLAASRPTRHPDDGATAELGVRLITVDRPGTGLSDPLPGRRVTDWASDVELLVDALGIDRFSALGWSGGGPHALACAVRLGDRVVRVGLVSSSPPLVGAAARSYLESKWLRIARLAQWVPWAMRPVFWHRSWVVHRDPVAAHEQSVDELVPPDRAILAAPGMHDMFVASTIEAFRQGARGVHADAVALARPWGFDLADVRQDVRLWQGLEDNVWSPRVARALGRMLRNSDVTLVPGEGHLLFLARWADLVAWTATGVDAAREAEAAVAYR